MSIQITNVRYSSATRTHETISDFKYRNEQTSKVGEVGKAGMVKWIDEGGKAWTGTGTSRVPVHTVHPSGRLPYCQTKSDGVWSNNLLALPTF